jgi:hypothetical protein
MRHLFSLLIIILAVNLSAQSIEASVKVEVPLLKPEQKERLVNIDTRIEDFINNNEWYPDGDPEIIIKANITIIIQSEYRSNDGIIYVAQFLISSASGENFYDKTWEFPYYPDEYWNFPINVFHPINSFIEYYLNMITGGEMDTYQELGGNDYYSRALAVCQQGKNSAYSKGWKSREEMVLSYTREFSKPLRIAKLVYYDVLDAEEHGELEQQLKYAKEMLELLEKSNRFQPNSLPMKRFMERHARKIAQFFQISPQREEYYQRLVNLDSRFKKDYAKILGIDD